MLICIKVVIVHYVSTLTHKKCQLNKSFYQWQLLVDVWIFPVLYRVPCDRRCIFQWDTSQLYRLWKDDDDGHIVRGERERIPAGAPDKENNNKYKWKW